MTSRGCTKFSQGVLVLAFLLTIGSLATADPIDAGDGVTKVHSISMVTVPTDASILIIGHLTLNGNALEGTSFFLHWDPNNPSGSKTTESFSLPDVAKAYGAHIAYILGPNALVTFTISSDQFVVHDFMSDSSNTFIGHRTKANTLILSDWLDSASEGSMKYILPHLPEDPDGEASIAFF